MRRFRARVAWTGRTAGSGSTRERKAKNSAYASVARATQLVMPVSGHLGLGCPPGKNSLS